MATSSSSAPSERVYRSCDVSTSVTIDVSGLHGRFAASEGEKKEVLVGVRILSSSATNSNSNNQENFTELTTSTSTRTSLYQNGCAIFQETIGFPMQVNDLPSDSVLELSLVTVITITRRAGHILVLMKNNQTEEPEEERARGTRTTNEIYP